jgi:hypothetical protein
MTFQGTNRHQGVLIIQLATMFFSLLFVPVAKSQIPASLSVAGERAGSGRNAEAVFRIQISSGAAGAAFGIAYKLPSWPTPAFVQGSPISITAVNFTGAGTHRPAMSLPVPKPLLKRRSVCSREGPSPFATSFWVEMPANSSAQLELRARAVYPSWPETEYALAFSAFEVDQPAAARTPLQTVSVPALGLRGSHITMRASKKTEAAKASARRMTPEIVGHTDPPLKRARISLRAVRPSPAGVVGLSRWSKPIPVAIPLGDVRTDQTGAFRLPSQPFRYEGRYAIVARSQTLGPIAADWNCGPFF